jgi:hypothetical protein
MLNQKWEANVLKVRMAGTTVGALALLIVGSPDVTSSAAALPAVVVTFSNSAPEQSTSISATVCWSRARSGEVVELDAATGLHHVWRVVGRYTTRTASGCEPWSLSSGAIGSHPFRSDVRLHNRVIVNGPAANLRTFGTIDAATFFSSEFGCTDSGTVSTGSHTYGYFCDMNTGYYLASGPNAWTFRHSTTCRSITLAMVATDDSHGDVSSFGTETLDVIQNSLDPQVVSFGDNQVQTSTFHLDGSAGQIEGWGLGDSNHESFSNYLWNNRVFFIANGSTADCSSLSGT